MIGESLGRKSVGSRKLSKLRLSMLLAAPVGSFLFIFGFSGQAVAKEDELIPASSCGKGLSGNVEVNRVRMTDGEQILQIIDHEHLVICYGKTASAGAATMSCQKFTEKKKN